MAHDPSGSGPLRLIWSNRAAKIGLLLCGTHMLFAGVMAVYHSLMPTDMPDDATPFQVFASLPAWERWLFGAGCVVFLVGLVVFVAAPSVDGAVEAPALLAPSDEAADPEEGAERSQAPTRTSSTREVRRR